MLHGFRDLPYLRRRLLPADYDADGEHDADLQAIGEGVAAAFDAFCGRRLRREVDAIYECSAEQGSIVLPLYPLEDISAVTLVDGEDETDITATIAGRNLTAGIVWFGRAPGWHDQQLRVTHTGGFWCQDGEEEMPAGATPLPGDILAAWIHQCRAIADAENLFRVKGAGRGDAKNAGPITLLNLELLPGVRKALQLYIRIA